MSSAYNKIGRGGDENALPPDGDAHRLGNLIEKHGRRFERAVAIAIFEHADAAVGRAVFAVLAAVVAHLGDPQFAVGAEIDRHGVLHHRFRGDKLDAQAIADFDRRQRFGRAFWQNALRAALLSVGSPPNRAL